MQGLGSLTDFIEASIKDCNSINKIQDINTQYNYKDKSSGGDSREWNLISCGQDGSNNSYNELQRFYDEHIPDKFKGLAFHQTAIKALCECCRELPHEKRTHEAFKKCLGDKLGIIIK